MLTFFAIVKVYLGQSEQSTLAGTYCGGDLPEQISSTTGFYLIFKSDTDANGKGFNITYNKQSAQGEYMFPQASFSW